VKSIELAAQAEMTIILYAINIHGADGKCIVSERRLLWFLYPVTLTSLRMSVRALN
jgi:hypothetical protein